MNNQPDTIYNELNSKGFEVTPVGASGLLVTLTSRRVTRNEVVIATSADETRIRAAANGIYIDLR